MKLPVKFDRPVEVTGAEVKRPGTFRAISYRNGTLLPCPYGRSWELVSINMGLTAAADVTLYLQRTLGEETHILWRIVTSTAIATGSPGVDTYVNAPVTTFPLPDILMEGGDQLMVIDGTGSVSYVDLHVIERDVLA